MDEKEWTGRNTGGVFRVKGAASIKKAADRHGLPLILAAAFLTVIAVMLLVRLPKAPKGVVVTERDGIYDLTGIPALDKTVVRLAPGSGYYPNIYLSPNDADSVASESTDRFEEIRADYLSQRFVLRLPDNSDTYALTAGLSGRHALRVYVNGRLVGQAGHPGTTKKETEVWENNITFYASAVDGKMEIILHSAQFYHARRGASLARHPRRSRRHAPPLYQADHRPRHCPGLGAERHRTVALLQGRQGSHRNTGHQTYEVFL